LLHLYLNDIDYSEIDKLKLDLGKGNPYEDSSSSENVKPINSISDVYSALNNKGMINKTNVLDIAKMLDGDSHAVK